MPSLVLAGLGWFEPCQPPKCTLFNSLYAGACIELINSSTAERNQLEFSAAGFVGIISPTEFIMPVNINTFKALLMSRAGASPVPQPGLGVTPFPHTESPPLVPPSLSSSSFAASWDHSEKYAYVVGSRTPAGVASKQRTGWL